MKHGTHYIIIMALAGFACLRHQAIEHSVRAVERPEVEITGSGSALIRSSSCDVIMEPMDRLLWSVLLRSDAYTRHPDREMSRRLPPLTFVHVIIRNTSASPLTVSSALVRFGNRTLPSLTALDLGRILASPAYSFLDFNSLLSFRRLMEARDSAALINYDTDTVGSLFPFIPPEDTALTLLAFDRIPSDIQSWRVSLTVKAGRNIKNIDFDFLRHEERTAGDGAGTRKLRKEKGYDY